ncbi:hypothetical protein V5F89_11130 [Pelagerythrobacter marensis]|uniref:Zinc-ribbon domain-containing protein n=1 Tax=Pelagerythrobacter marensis TaxID=543877 RepID=A0ABZ2D6G7_9SPHN
MPKGNFQGFVVPEPWANDGGKRREPVLDADHTPPRVVRHVGWQHCITCRKPFWSNDVIALRRCPSCKGVKNEYAKPLRKQETGRA